MDAKRVEVVIPDVDAMSDEDIEEFVRSRDGRWSWQTKSLLRKFQTEKLNLNRAWAGTSTVWRCPSCLRAKPQVVRLSPSGVLLCQLESHHDHLGDVVAAIFREHNPHTEDMATNNQLDQAKYALLSLTERFPRTVICLDCNLVEGKAKKAVGVPAHFSFSPQEIAVFVRPIDNKAHDFDLHSAGAIWGDVKEDVDDRLDFASRMAKRVAKGRHLRQPNVGERVAFEFVSQHTILSSMFAHTGYEDALHNIEGKLLSRSLARDAVGQSVKAKSKPAGRIPTDEEFAGINAQNADQKHWNASGDDWTCRCCGRTKRQICRKSNRGKWTAHIHVLREWVFEKTYGDAPWYEKPTEGREIVDHRPVLVCQDCRDIVSDMQRRDAAISGDCLTIADIIDCIIDSANNRVHEVDHALVMERARANADLVDAVKSYREFESRARLYFERVKLFAASNRCSTEEAIEHFVYQHTQTFGVEMEEAKESVEWMFWSGQRFKEMDD